MRKALAACLALLVVGGLWGCAPKLKRPDALNAALKEGRWGHVGGLTVKRPDVEVASTKDKAIYLNERYGLTAYRIAAKNGAYVVRLHFAETFEGITEAGQRVYSVAIEGKPALEDFDPFQEAGGKAHAAVVKTFDVDVQDGELTLDFTEKTQKTMVNGIEVVTPCGCAALRINCGAAEPYTDAAKHVWKPDQAFPTP